jgi:hypothetical protein
MTWKLDAEDLLPPALLAKATRRGNELAWPLEVVPEVIAAGCVCGLATLGGQIQFRVPDGTCELYWLNANSSPRGQDESWSEYVVRSAVEVGTGFAGLPSGDDMLEEGLGWEVLARLHAGGTDIGQYLCFVLDFVSEEEFRDLARRAGRHPAT